ncbi:AMP-binding protein [Streptomyces lydicus]|nr:AMP-binding protein [Streptomyces lydicus]
MLIVDAGRGCAVPEGTVGEIWVSGPSVAEGYRGAPEATAATFGPGSPARKGPSCAPATWDSVTRASSTSRAGSRT